MDIYHISYPYADGQQYRWAGNLVSANKIAREAVKAGEVASIDSVKIKQMQLPDERKEMIIWLDTHFQQWIIK